MALLLDIGPVACDCTNHALELFSKALSGENGSDDGIWQPHDSPFISHLIELFTQKGLTKLSDVHAELQAWIAGQRYQKDAWGKASKPASGVYRAWTPAEMDLVELYLSSLAPEQFALEDWGFLIDYLIQRYLPLGELQKDTEALAVRAALMGKAQSIVEAITPTQAAHLLEVMPESEARAKAAIDKSRHFEAAMEYGRQHAGENVKYFTESARHRLRATVLDHVALKMQGDPHALYDTKLQQELLDDFGTLNRDWRRIAVTEAGEIANQGLVASLEPGARVKRMEVYNGACAFCRKIDGLVMNVVSASDPDKDGWRDVWPGKTNIGRSAAKRKRIGNELVERDRSETWWPAAGVQHPHCRGQWHVVRDTPSAGDPKFSAWLRAHLAAIE
ncbi:hypothetical protein [Burkholderia sp. Ac-20349]|uniref:hypothetical protein n=1 Tax=Burkholderia sp. Ac-20349 TaxID=2703893 RepID=UPI00197B12CB|nr:hypothetical protein [Burkholderia sp. Ac-20349]MBN3839219.1 hypothetical protein [Burkholderia sp. Ac-20349]